MNRLPFAVILFLAVLAAAFLAPSNRASAASYVVDTTADDIAVALTACTGAAADCSLRGAIADANGSGPGDTITFDTAVFTGGPGTPTAIIIADPLPALSGGDDTIDGGATRSVLVDGTNETPTFPCLTVASAANVITNLQFTDCIAGILLNNSLSDNNVLGPGNVIFDNSFGIQTSVASATGNLIKGNFIGTTADGTAAHGSGGNDTGVHIGSGSNTIGGTSVADRNIISGNNGAGLRIQDNVVDNDVFGNYIGTDVTGTVDLGNPTGLILQTASFTDIGGTLAGQPNLISGNSGINVGVQQNSSNNRIVNNTIGPNITGSGASMTNGGTGILIVNGSDNNEITGNLISDNSAGILIQDSNTNGNIVRGNFIGTGPGGSGSVPNSGFGVGVDNSSHDNTIGGTLPGEGNVIANNGGAGVLIVGAATTGNRIRGNSIHDNVGSEISLLAGGNTELPPPTILEAGAGAVSGSSSCGSCIVDVYSDGGSDAEVFEGTTTADGDGFWVLYDEIEWSNVTATVTDALGNTSQLSASVPIPTGLDFDDDNIPDALDNCAITANGPRQAALLGVGNQTDADGDGVNGAEGEPGSNWGGDACDVDDDNDGIPDTMDICRTLAEDYDGYQDGDTCPDVDNDSDGICDDGLVSVSCTGSDVGKSCFDPAGTLACHLAAASDCRNIAEDQDGFKDSDGCPEPDNDNDGFPDYADNCPGTGQLAGPDGMLGAAQDANHNGVQDGLEPAFSTDDLQVTFEDYDTVLDGDGCHDSPGDDFDGDGLTDEAEVFTYLTLPYNPDSDADTVVDGTDNCPNWPNAAQNVPSWTIPANDSDCDGFNVAREQFVGTDPTKHCNLTTTANDEAVDYWPSDFNDSRSTNLSDLILMGPSYNKLLGNPAYNPRFDLNASNSVSLSDVILLGPFYNKSCG